jgi:hypothetical protein
MLCIPVAPRAHWYWMDGDPYSYGGAVAHPMDLLKNDLDWVEIDSWYMTEEDLWRSA